MGGKEGERLVLSLFAPAYPAVDNLLGDGSALDNQCNTVVLFRVVDVDTAGIDTDELVLVRSDCRLIETDTSDPVIHTVEDLVDVLDGVVEVACLAGKLFKAFAGVVVEVVFVKLEVYDSGG